MQHTPSDLFMTNPSELCLHRTASRATKFSHLKVIAGFNVQNMSRKMLEPHRRPSAALRAHLYNITANPATRYNGRSMGKCGKGIIPATPCSETGGKKKNRNRTVSSCSHLVDNDRSYNRQQHRPLVTSFPADCNYTQFCFTFQASDKTLSIDLKTYQVDVS